MVEKNMIVRYARNVSRMMTTEGGGGARGKAILGLWAIVDGAMERNDHIHSVCDNLLTNRRRK
jgi:hypothetical protein